MESKDRPREDPIQYDRRLIDKMKSWVMPVDLVITPTKMTMTPDGPVFTLTNLDDHIPTPCQLAYRSGQLYMITKIEQMNQKTPPKPTT